MVLYTGRHGAGTELAKITSLKQVMDILGHTQTKTAMRYQHQEVEELQETGGHADQREGAVTEERDFQSQERELVTANHCFALVSQFSERAFLEGRLDVAEGSDPRHGHVAARI